MSGTDWQGAAERARRAAEKKESAQSREMAVPDAVLGKAERLDLSGQKAWYSPSEEQLVRELAVSRSWVEIVVMHELKLYATERPGERSPFDGSSFATSDDVAKEEDQFEQARTGMEEGIRRVDRAADPTWKDRALEAVKRTCETRADFISDDVWEVGDLDSTVEDRALGPVMMAAKKAGWCERTTEQRPSVRSHLSGKPVWRSLIYASKAEPADQAVLFGS